MYSQAFSEFKQLQRHLLVRIRNACIDSYFNLEYPTDKFNSNKHNDIFKNSILTCSLDT